MLSAMVGGKEITWTERRLVVRSLAHAQSAEAGPHNRLEKAQNAIEALNERKRGKERLTDVVRVRLAKTGEKLRGLYAGNPTRATDQPTAEAILQGFKDIFLSFVTFGAQTYRHLTPLSDLRLRILSRYTSWQISIPDSQLILPTRLKK